MPDITISLTDTENKASNTLRSQSNWADNALTNRARIAKDEIIEKLVNTAMRTASYRHKDAQVTQAFDLDVVDTAAKYKQQQTAASAAMAASSSSE